MDCSFLTNTYTFVDIVNCSILNTGLSFDFFVLLIYAVFVVFVAMARLDFDFSLAIAIALTYSLMLLSGPMGGSTILIYLWGLLLIGAGLRILMGAIAIFRQ